MSGTFALSTLGCKVNQVESAHIAEGLLAAGWREGSFRERADLYVVHSCAVTAHAGFETRRLLRIAARGNPQARIAVLGCDAELDHERLAPLATHILGNREKYALLEWLGHPGTLGDPCDARSDSRRFPPPPSLAVTRMLEGRARAFLKVQDGCDAFCTYCVVPRTRGRSASLPLAEVAAGMARLSGYAEVVLTGIHMGRWGRDLTPEDSLASLLAVAAEGVAGPRVRLSSLEPTDMTPGVLALLPTLSRLVPHFHVPLQSGAAETLRRMGRPYAPEAYRALLWDLRRLFPRTGLGCDVMAGFPGETEAHFGETFALIEALPLSRLHVFPYSPRPGTPAERFSGRLGKDELSRRAKALRDLGDRKAREFAERQVGTWVEVVVEGHPAPGWARGTSENYLAVTFPARPAPPPGTLVRVRVTRAEGAEVTGAPDAP